MDDRGVFGIPLRLLISIVMGGMALAIILQLFYYRPAESLDVSWDKDVYSIDSDGYVTIKVFVKGSEKNLSNAQVVISGLKDIASNITNDGKTILKLKPKIDDSEGYLSIEVRVKGYQKFFEKDAIKVVKDER